MDLLLLPCRVINRNLGIPPTEDGRFGNLYIFEYFWGTLPLPPAILPYSLHPPPRTLLCPPLSPPALSLLLSSLCTRALSPTFLPALHLSSPLFHPRPPGSIWCMQWDRCLGETRMRMAREGVTEKRLSEARAGERIHQALIGQDPPSFDRSPINRVL